MNWTRIKDHKYDFVLVYLRSSSVPQSLSLRFDHSCPVFVGSFPIRSFVRAFFRSFFFFVPSFFPPFLRSFFRSFVLSFVRSLVRSSVRALVLFVRVRVVRSFVWSLFFCSSVPLFL